MRLLFWLRVFITFSLTHKENLNSAKVEPVVISELLTLKLWKKQPIGELVAFSEISLKLN